MLDWIFVILMGLAFYRGYTRGLLLALVSFLGVIVGVVGALKLSGFVAQRLAESYEDLARWAPLLSYLLVFFVIVVVLRLVTRLIQKVVDLVALGWVNRLAGGVVYVLFAAFIFSFFVGLLHKMGLIGKETAAGSVVFPWLQIYESRVISFLGVLFPFVKAAYADLNAFFERINQKLVTYVGAYR